MFALMLATIFAATVTGCATQGNKDPLEGLNRGIYKFNDVADKAVIKPVASAYKAMAPTAVRTGVNNFFSNIGTFISTINNLLQFKFSNAMSEAGRFVINTTVGIGGLIDVASMDKIPRHKEDFGQTLGYWGVGNGAYLVLPIFGPSTLRDASGLLVDTIAFDPITYLHNNNNVAASNVLQTARIINKRAGLLPGSDLFDAASLDPYAFMRDAYLQRSASLVQDGLVPTEFIKDEFEGATPVNARPANTSPTAPANETMKDTLPVINGVPSPADADLPPLQTK